VRIWKNAKNVGTPNAGLPCPSRSRFAATGLRRRRDQTLSTIGPTRGARDLGRAGVEPRSDCLRPALAFLGRTCRWRQAQRSRWRHGSHRGRATGVPFPVDMDSMPSVGAFTSEEEAQAERSGLPVQASGPLQRLTGTPSGLLGWRRRTLAESLGGYRPSLFRRCTATPRRPFGQDRGPIRTAWGPERTALPV